jgi:hypothetical protein
MKCRELGLALCLWLLMVAPVSAQLDFNFMPKGGKALLIQVLGDKPAAAAVRGITEARRGEQEWRKALEAKRAALSEKELRTLAAYLAVNMPLSEAALQEAEAKGDWQAALPPDGRELAWEYCQGCHSFFSGYLMQERSVEFWLGTFNSPFHRKIEMKAKERETFARYSAVNMPMKMEDVPEDLRF